MPFIPGILFPAKTDTDDDHLNDSDELFTYHTNPLLAKTNPDQPFSDFYMVNQADGDADGIPNGIEQWYADQGLGMNPADPADARGDLDGDGYTNLQAYSNGWSLTSHTDTYDYDQDGILDVLEDAWNAAYPGIFDNHNFNDSVEDFDGDGLMNFEEIALGLNPGKANSRHTSVSDVQEWAWRGLVVGGPVGLSFAGLGLNSSTQPEWQVMEDANHDSLPDGLLALVTALNADATLVTLPQRVASGDYDGDSMLDYWEHRYNLDLRSAADAQANPDGDTLINSLEYAHGRNPLVSDDPPPEDPPVPPQIITTSLPDGMVNSGYNFPIQYSGGMGIRQFSISGSPPDGLFLDTYGSIVGTPTTEMSSTFTVQMSDSNGLSASQTFTLNVLPDTTTGGGDGTGGTGGNGNGGTSPPPPLVITTTDAQMHAVIGRPFSVTLEATGGISNHYIFASGITGTLPTGLEISEDHKTIQGTPTVTGSCTFNVTLTNASPDGFIVPDSSSYVFTLTVHDLLAFVTDAELPHNVLGGVYSVQMETSGGYGQKLFSLTSGALPPGIELTSGGQFLGAPSETGHYAFTVHVADALGLVKDQEFTMDVAEPPRLLAITTASLPTGGVGLGYSAGIGASGGDGNYTFTGGGGPFSVSSNGGISGFPTEPGVYAVSVTVTDTAEGTASASFVISVAAPTLTVTSGDKQILKVGETPAPVTVSLTAGGVGLAGVQLSMGTQTTITDEGGSATFLPQALMTEGQQNFAVNFPGGGATVPMYAYTPPAGAGGAAPQAIPGPPDVPPVTPVQDEEVIVESRWVSVSSGTLQAQYSPGLAFAYIAGILVPFFDGYHPPDYSSTKTSWSASDGRSQEGTPPDLDTLPWVPGSAGGYDKKYPDSESGPVDGPGDGTGGGTIWPEMGFPFRIAYNGGYFGKSVGREKKVTSQVRIRRKTVEEGGSGNNEAKTKPFLDLTTKLASDGVETLDSSSMKSLNLSAGQSESPPTTISPAAAVGEARRENLLPVEIKRDEEGGSIVWESMSGKNGRALPGQRINLRIEVPGLPSSMRPTAVKWTVKGKTFSNYVAYQSSENTNATKDEVGDLVGEEMALYWSEPGSHEIKVEFSLSGQTCTHTQNFEIIEPVSRLTGSTGFVVLNSGIVELQGLGGLGGGIAITAEVESLKPTFDSEGEWQFVQMINAKDIAYTASGTTYKNPYYNLWVLDTEYPYKAAFTTGSGSTTTHDSPASDILNSARTEAMSDNFKMYLMFKPPGENTRWVPLKVLQWYWHWTASKKNGVWNLDDKGTDASPSTKTSDHPIWSLNTENDSPLVPQ